VNRSIGKRAGYDVKPKDKVDTLREGKFRDDSERDDDE
jgi:hypothetical protein